jgi:HTH-type transcriptional regulator, sugar sensing transcriptional regulator
MSSAEHLVRLGLNKNEAKTLDALIALGPAGASDVHRYAEIPRNKAYESLEKLASKGMVEVQNGRPTLYKAMGVKTIIDQLLDGYGSEAKQALGALERKQEESSGGEGEAGGGTSAWVVRGELGVKRRLAELIYGAKSDIFAIGGYPPKYPLSVKTALKAAAARGVRTKVVSMVSPLEDIEVSSDDRSVVEFRTVKTSPTLKMKLLPYDEKIVGTFAGMQGQGAMVVIDETTAFDIVDSGTDPKKATGIVIKAPGVPAIQKATAERIVGLYTRKL